jgi:dephospho-CoA kinase
MKCIIGLVGEKGSGKGTFITLLQEIAQGTAIERIASSSLLGDTLDLWSIPRTRRNLQDLAIVMNQHYGDTTLSTAVYHRIEKSTADIVIFDGMRWMSDLDMIRSFPENILVYVTTDIRKRYERTKLRQEKKDESSVSYDQFLAEEQVKTELDIVKIGERAEIKIVNNGSLDEYKKSVEEAWTKIQQLL